MQAPLPISSKASLSETGSGELLPQEPPAKVIRWIAWLLLAIFLSASLVIFLVPIPESVRSPFVLVAESGADPVQSPFLGVIARVSVQEGEAVAEGQELFVLRSNEIRAWQTQLRLFQEDLQSAHLRKEKFDQIYAKLIAIKAQEISRIEQELDFRKKHLAMVQDYLKKMRALQEAELVPEVEMARTELSLAESHKEANVTAKELQQAILDRERLEVERAREVLDAEADLRKLQVRIDSLTRQLADCEGDLYHARAPYAAVVIALSQHNEGTVVALGETLCELSPVQGQPRARLALPESGLPHLARGQPVRFFFEAFPFQRYGSMEGELEWVSPSAVSSGSLTGFVGLASLKQFELNSRERIIPVRVGMSGQARINIGTRTLAEYFFEPLKALRENLTH